MAAKIKIPYLNPIQFRQLPEGKFACDLIPSFEQKAYYIQKFQVGDKLRFQVQLLKNSWTSIDFQILDSFYNLVTSYTGGLIGDNGDYNIWSVRLTDDVLNLPDGIYFVHLRIGTPEYEVTFLSEPFEVVDELKESLLIEYSHDGNDFDMTFFPGGVQENQRFFQLRVEGGIISDGFIPSSKDSFYIDQVRDVVMLSSIPYNVFRFTFGPGGGLPNWMADKINRILSLAYVEINGRQYVKNEGAKLDPIREKGYPFSGWQIDMVEVKAKNSLEEGEVIQRGDFNPDYNPDYF